MNLSYVGVPSHTYITFFMQQLMQQVFSQSTYVKTKERCIYSHIKCSFNSILPIVIFLLLKVKNDRRLSLTFHYMYKKLTVLSIRISCNCAVLICSFSELRNRALGI